MTTLDWFLILSVLWQTFRISRASRRIDALEKRLNERPSTIGQIGRQP